MAAPFCRQCGAPLDPQAAFCARCGSPVAGSPSAGTAPPTAVPPPPPPPPPDLSDALRVAALRRFLVQHLLIGPKHSYRVIAENKTPLFTVGEEVRGERAVAWVSFVRPSTTGNPHFRAGPGMPMNPERLFYWGVEDREGNLRASLELQQHRASGFATLAGPDARPLLTVHVQQHMATLTANAAAWDGRPMLAAQGSVLHHNFSVHDPGGTEVAKIHESYASARDTYSVDLVGPVDPVAAVIFAILIDHFKGK